ncbi:MAG: MBL fold metallo-hydrolase [Bacteroidia bacterium]
MRILLGSLMVALLMMACEKEQGASAHEEQHIHYIDHGIELVVLGTVQDAGSPHMGCRKLCCKDLFGNPDTTRKVVSLGILDHNDEKTWLFEATPDIVTQCKKLKRLAGFADKETPDGIFLTHAHIGHYAGLMYLGREALGSDQVPVYAMPRMRHFLESNGPWDQLVALDNIDLQSLKADSLCDLSRDLAVQPFLVPHRDEYSETVGYAISGPDKRALFIPDIDKWSKWKKNIIDEIAKVDFAFLDATFFDGEEINYRDIAQIPHPFIIESMELFASLPEKEKSKIYFIHLNHTNPALNTTSPQYQRIIDAGFKVAQIGQRFQL